MAAEPCLERPGAGRRVETRPVDRATGAAPATRRRVALQVSFALLFLACFATAAVVPAPAWLPVDLFFLADPLLAGAGALAARALLVAPLAVTLPVLLATAVLGRVFCGYVCPLGSCQDWTAARPAKDRRGDELVRRGGWLRWALLGTVALAAAAGIPAAWLVDPLAILWRGLAFALYPLSLAGADLGLGGLRTLLGAVTETTPLAFALPHRVFALASAGLSLALLGGILAASRFVPRLWCRMACPLGALLSLAAARPWLRRVVAPDACLSCTGCERACSMGLARRGAEPVPPGECLACLRCAASCPAAAVRLTLSPPWRRVEPSGEALPVLPRRGPEPAPGVSRRSLLTGTACGLGGVLLADRLAWPALGPPFGRGGAAVLRPPGAVDGDGGGGGGGVAERCLRCGACMQACPTNVIQPDVAPADLGGFFAPVLTLRLGGCDPACTRCGEVCPSGALAALSPEEKRRWVIGTAVPEDERCVAPRGRECRACAEVCPYEAVGFYSVEGGVVPRVDPERCTGCGLCELRCPVPDRTGRSRLAAFSDRAAIRVLPVDEAARVAPPVPEPQPSEAHLPLFLRAS